LYGDGEQTRSFCYVDDLVDALIRLMNTPDDVTGPMNIGNPGEFTIKELADLVVEMTKSDVPIEVRPLPEDDPTRRCPDITLAKKTIDWEPTIQLREGLARTIAYFRETASPAVP
jgi:UDP-glucuronate decarboxylase